jgi:hypothetical protein
MKDVVEMDKIVEATRMNHGLSYDFLAMMKI